MVERKGIVLAGGSGTRLYPLTRAVSKQLMAVYDKPLIYYPLTVLMLADLRDIAIITTPHDQEQFRRALGDGSQWGLRFTYLAQPSPDGLAQAFLLAEEFLAGAPSALVLGDNLFFGHGLSALLTAAAEHETGATVFAYFVADPERYGVVEFDAKGLVKSIVEKPKEPRSNYALTGLYFVDGTAPARARTLKPSARGELEIVDLLESYRRDDALTVELLGRGYAWLDTGTHRSLLDAANFVATLQVRQGLLVGCPEEIAFRKGWITAGELRVLAEPLLKSEYGKYLLALADEASA